MAYNASDFITKHIIAAYANIKSVPVVNGIEKNEDALSHKIVIDTLATLGSGIFRAAYIKVDGKQAYPEVTSMEAGSTAQLRVESRPDGIGLTKLVSAGGGLAPTPVAWKHEINGLYVAAHRLTTVIVPAGGMIGLVADVKSHALWGFSIDGDVIAQWGVGGVSNPNWTGYRISDDGTIYTDDIGDNGYDPFNISKGIRIVSQNNTAMKYLILKAPSDTNLTVITTNEVMQVTEAAL